ncbi:MAG TPA: glycine--tRNA ligase subunit beta [Casimicrobiaceae bacterium]|nr:glycine--tRNA ligase subunit beta [Casimicrobiaceae bacterium]
MATNATLVVELLTEELPPKALKSLGEHFATSLAEGLRAQGLLGESAAVTPYATPRRLAVAIGDVRAQAPNVPTEQKLLPATVAVDANGNVSDAFRKKMSALGRPHLATKSLDASEGTDTVYVKEEGKSAYVYLRSLTEGQSLSNGLATALSQTIERLPIAKVMRYAGREGYYNDIAFARPAHRLLALHGQDVVPIAVLGLDADRLTDGHRFLSRSGISIPNAAAYAPTLEAEGKVMPSFAARRAAIEAGLAKAAQGDRVIAPAALLDEVTSLVEWPAVYAGTFDTSFLDVPQECLILTMQQNQKYFALTDSEGRMRARFLVVSNVATTDPHAIVSGNERVLRARLADAKFFYDQDRRQRLEDRLPRLAAVVYHQKLGTLAERVDRLRFLASAIARTIGADEAQANRAAMLAKADLVSEMVGEFPELQGTMGRYYAVQDGEVSEVADAIAQHYCPRFAGDGLPESRVAQSVALADKLESLAGLFGIGQVPTGDKDPFGLRRAAIGVIRILVEKQLDVSLNDLAKLAFDAFADVAAVKPEHDALIAFMLDRLRGYLRDQGGSANEIEALLAGDVDSLVSLPARLAALREFEALPEADALAAANKRIVNILRKSGSEAANTVDRTLLAEGAEHDLWRTFKTLHATIAQYHADARYGPALKALATTKPVVDRYFDDVMVMVDDPAVRANRLALLRDVATTMNRVADISKLAK